MSTDPGRTMRARVCAVLARRARSGKNHDHQLRALHSWVSRGSFRHWACETRMPEGRRGRAICPASSTTIASETRETADRCIAFLPAIRVTVSGLRVSEARNLEVQDVDLNTALLTIRGTKFGKTRLVPLHQADLCLPLTHFSTPALPLVSGISRLFRPLRRGANLALQQFRCGARSC